MNNRSMDYTRRFGGLARLYGELALARFAAAQVIVVGVGGVGCWAAEALARSGIGRLTLIDLDHVAESNVNRQIQAMDGTFGRAKVEVLRDRLLAINPGCRINPVEDFVAEENLEALIPGDTAYVMDCIDSYRIKAAMVAFCRRQKIPLIVAGGAGGQIDPLRIRLGDLSRTEQDPLLSKTRKLLRKSYGFSRNPKRRFEVPCVYSTEQVREPAATESVCAATGAANPVTGLNCAGYGASMAVTATFGLVAVSHVLRKLSEEISDKEVT